MSYERPAYLDEVKTEPQYLISCDPRELQEAAREVPASPPRQPEIYRPMDPAPTRDVPEPSEPRTRISDKRVNDVVTKPQPTKPSFTGTAKPEAKKEVFDLHREVPAGNGMDELEPIRHTDILTLKKQVIEEIKNELELAGQGKRQFPGIGRPGYVDPFSRLDQTQNQKDGDKIQLKGSQKPKITLDENDDMDDTQSQVIANQRKAQAEIDQEYSATKGSDVRKSVQTIISQRQSLTESQVLNAIADVIMQDINGSQDGISTGSYRGGHLSQSVERQIGEDMLIDKINQIFDEVAHDRD